MNVGDALARAWQGEIAGAAFFAEPKERAPRGTPERWRVEALAALEEATAARIAQEWLSRRDGRWPFFLLALSFRLSGPLTVAYLLITGCATRR